MQFRLGLLFCHHLYHALHPEYTHGGSCCSENKLSMCLPTSLHASFSLCLEHSWSTLTFRSVLKCHFWLTHPKYLLMPKSTPASPYSASFSLWRRLPFEVSHLLVLVVFLLRMCSWWEQVLCSVKRNILTQRTISGIQYVLNKYLLSEPITSGFVSQQTKIFTRENLLWPGPFSKRSKSGC